MRAATNTKKSKTYILGLTGGLASGKTTVAGLLAACGAKIIDADAIVHNLQGPNTPQTQAIVAKLGKGILQPNGAIDRKKLAQTVAKTPEVLPFLENILHPAVRKEEEKQIALARKEGINVVVLDVPLLFEAGLNNLCSGVALCYSPLEERKKRAFLRPGMTEEKWHTLLKRRWPDKKALKAANFLIHTDGTLEDTKEQTEALYKELTSSE